MWIGDVGTEAETVPMISAVGPCGNNRYSIPLSSLEQWRAALALEIRQVMMAAAARNVRRIRRFPCFSFKSHLCRR
jgi:hypothetical protein